MSTVDGMRMFMLFLIACVLLAMVVRFFQVGKHFSLSLRMLMGSLMFLLITAAWDTKVLLDVQAPFGWRMFPLSVGIALSIAALFEPGDSLRRRYGQNSLSRDVRLKMKELEVAELHDRLYDSLRRENKASTLLLLTQSELDRANAKEEARRERIPREDA